VNVATGFAFPLDDGVEPELHERERAGVFFAAQEDDVRVATQHVQALADVRSVQIAAQRIRNVIKAACRRCVVGQACRLDAVGRSPGKVHIMCVGFQERVLHVEVVEQDRPLAVTQIGEPFQPLEIPVVVLG
jgi:hypothetical protein